MQQPYNKHQLLEVFEQAGLDVDNLILTLTSNRDLLRDNVGLLAGIMDENTTLREQIKVLELDIMIRILKKISE
jgi:hypothetical protein